MENKVIPKNIFMILLLLLILFGTCYFFYQEDKSLKEKSEVIPIKKPEEVTEVKTLEKKSFTNFKNDYENHKENIEKPIEEKEEIKQENDYLIESDFLEDNYVTDEEVKAMNHNTQILQKMVNNASENQTIKLPSGIYYFARGDTNKTQSEDYVIKLKNHVHIEGSGTTEQEYTILKPYAKENTIKYGLDMFYYNELSDSNFENPLYLEDISFKNFIIDGESVRGINYNSSGKGFMINLCKNCSWDNITIKNTDGTGFGMDNVINGSIKNSTAINCGKNATENSEGASGFGIGTGYSDEESMIIENCISIGNKKFGFFFENQNRFTSIYQATKSKSFIVKNSFAKDNLYNFGGLRANNVSYIDCNSEKGTRSNTVDIYFDDQSRQTNISNFTTNNMFKDINENSGYYEAAKWAYTNGISNGVANNKFGLGETITRAEAISLIWRYAGRPGNIISQNQLSRRSNKITNITTGFDDVDGSLWYANAIKWGKENNIINGTTATTFSPETPITREQFIMMLYRLAGQPTVESNYNFSDVPKSSIYYNAINWAATNKITLGTSASTFSPKQRSTREQIITFLYRYNKI